MDIIAIFLRVKTDRMKNIPNRKNKKARAKYPPRDKVNTKLSVVRARIKIVLIILKGNLVFFFDKTKDNKIDMGISK